MTVKAVLFDLDGTILNTLSDLTDSVNFMLNELGFPTHSEEKIRSITGNGAKNLIRCSLPENSSDEVFERALAVYKEHYEKNKSNKTAPYDGIMPLLSELKKRGVKLAIISNKHDDAVQGLSKSFFADLMDFTIGNRDDIKKKPDPDMLYLALDELGISADEAVYVGDSEVDIQTAKNTNLPCISVTWGFRDRDVLIKSGAEKLASSPEELLSIINDL